jgi:CRISPR-associated endoribonuclease Cas6
MLTEVGLMRDALKFDEVTMRIDGRVVYCDGEFHLDAIEPQSFTPTLTSDFYGVTLELTTPLRIKKHNRFLRDDIDIVDILRSIHQREQQLCYGKSYAKLDFTPSYTTLSKQLHYKTLIRKSNRQKSKMNMDGIIGELTLTDLDPNSYRLLKLGEILGVGKQTVMGLGSIRLT